MIVPRLSCLLWLSWSLTTGAAEQVVFSDGFDTEVGAGWSWLREDPSGWRIRDEALEIRVVPGKAQTVKNALVRSAPDRRQDKTYLIDVTVTNTTPPIEQYEQMGLTWYHDGQPVFKLVKERIDGDTWIIPGRIPMKSETVQLRLIISGRKCRAQFRANGQGEFQTAAEVELPEPGNDQVSLQCYDGPANAEHWMRFDNFQITELTP